MAKISKKAQALKALSEIGEAHGIATPPEVQQEIAALEAGLPPIEQVTLTVTEPTGEKVGETDPNLLAAVEATVEKTEDAGKTVLEAEHERVEEAVVEIAQTRKVFGLELPAGTKQTAMYFITPKMGGKERWFSISSLDDFDVTGDGFIIYAQAKVFKERGLFEDTFEVVPAQPEAEKSEEVAAA